MKKMICFIFAIMFCFSSCSLLWDRRDYPLTSENFDLDFRESFFNTYYMADPQLIYTNSAPLEIEIRGNLEPHTEYDDPDRFYISVIDSTPKEDFLAVTERNQETSMMGGIDQCTYRVYQSDSAPVPMRDWTIKSISVFYSTPGFTNVKKADERAQHPMDNALFGSGGIIKTYTQEDSPAFLASFSESYQNRINKYPEPIANEVLRSANDLYQCYLLIRFEENDNLVWYVPLVEYKEGIGCALIFYLPVTRYHNPIYQFLKIDETFSTDILNAIDEADIPSKSGS
ncbi:MAG: hypothetical protein E7666_07130 [Ruminococcaceae bacterium]|nr:hypothetical protein [Oscillospiraceae bacterium]